MRFVIVTGMSGAGKSTTLKMMEDMGYFCVDNMPIPLMTKLTELLIVPNGEITKIALGLDIRSEDYDSLGGYIIELLDHLPKQGDTVTDGVIFCKVTQMVKNRVLRVLVEILPKAEKNEETK